MVKNKGAGARYYRTWHKITKYIDFDNGERTCRLSLARAHPAHGRRVLGSARLLAGGLVAGGWAELGGRL